MRKTPRSFPEVPSQKTCKPEQERWLGQLTFDRVKDFLNSLWLVAVWSAAGRNLQHIIRTVLCEELQGKGERSQERGLWLAEWEGRLPAFVKRQRHFLHPRGRCSLFTRKSLCLCLCLCPPESCSHYKFKGLGSRAQWCCSKQSNV